MTRFGSLGKWSLVAILLAGLAGCSKAPQPGHVEDEARLAGRPATSFPAADEDYFHDMDQDAKGQLVLTADEIKGRNMWLVWTGGDDKFWDGMSAASIGTLDFLKTLSSKPGLKASRDNRWNYLGLVNEPCFDKATGPDPNRYGLWLDKRRADCPPDPFENESKYPGVKIGARGKNLPVGSYYGWATGIVGLRLFPNPDFDEAAAKKWDPKRFYDDPTLLQRQEPGAAVPRGHDLRFLSRRTESDQAAGRSGESEVGELELECRRAIFLDRSHLCLGSRSQQLPLSALPYLAARRARYLAGFSGQHQQPAHHECGIRTWLAVAGGQALGQGNSGGR